VALVSYANAARHKGDIYRFDGWTKVQEVKGGTAGQTWDRPRKAAYEAKSVWAYKLPQEGDDIRRGFGAPDGGPP